MTAAGQRGNREITGKACLYSLLDLFDPRMLIIALHINPGNNVMRSGERSERTTHFGMEDEAKQEINVGLGRNEGIGNRQIRDPI